METDPLPTRFLLTLAVVCAAGWADAARFPDDAGVVIATEFGATPGDASDDTAAIQAAVTHAIESSNRYASPKVCYLPAGEYLVSGPIESRVSDRGWSGGWRCGMILFGDGPDTTVLRLVDDSPGYDDLENPKWVVATGSENRTRGKEDAERGGGNEAFHHHLEGFSIDVGRRNPGAVALDYVASNRGSVIDVTLRAGAGSGYCGLSLERWWPGPCFVRGLTIEGFGYGVRTEHYQYGATFEDLTLRGQRVAGVWNPRNVLSIHRMQSDNRVPVFTGGTRHGLVTLLDAELRGDDPNATAIDTANRLYLRDVRTPGYGMAVRDQTEDRQVVGPGVDFYASNATGIGLAPEPMRLEVRDTPRPDPMSAADWISVGAFGAEPGDGFDDADAIQRAIDSGAEVVYLPNGDYHLGRTLRVADRPACSSACRRA